MRTIKFRGKCSTVSCYKGEWVCGFYVQSDDGDSLIVRYITDTVSTTYHVESNTVSQFTGLFDKNGKEIYEGDILKMPGVIQKLEVRFVRGVFAFLWEGNLDDEFPTGSPTHEWAEVIGNIYDNPRMLKKRH